MDAKDRIELELEVLKAMANNETEEKIGEFYILDESLVEKGTIHKQIVYQGKKHEIDLLALSPGAETKEYQIEGKTEYHIVLDSNVIEVCTKYLPKRIKNPKKTEYLFILVIKEK